jgi:cytochrome c-type biogenesis protein CcsB
VSDQSWAQLSNVAVYSAMAVYAVALGAFVWDLALRGGRLPASVSSPVSAGASTRELVGAGAGAAVTEAGDVAGDGGEVDLAAVGPTAANAGRRAGVGGSAMSLTWLALGLHLAGVVARATATHRPPWGNMYEFSVAGSLVVTGVFLVVATKRDLRYLGTFVVGPVLLTLGLAVTVFYVDAGQLVPALHSYWLGIHVSIAFVASALLTLGFSATLLQLVQHRRETALAAGEATGPLFGRLGRFMDGLPTSSALELTGYRMHVAAFPLWGFTLVAGAIWAEGAWGRYWNWDPKEVWTFVIWVVYAAYLHARATRGWDGRRASMLALLGYGCLLFNFLVVNIWFVGKHSYGR